MDRLLNTIKSAKVADNQKVRGSNGSPLKQRTGEVGEREKVGCMCVHNGRMLAVHLRADKL